MYHKYVIFKFFLLFSPGGYYENINNIDLGQVRLAFQAFLPDDSGKYNRIVPPVYSQLIYDKSEFIYKNLHSNNPSPSRPHVPQLYIYLFAK